MAKNVGKHCSTCLFKLIIETQYNRGFRLTVPLLVGTLFSDDNQQSTKRRRIKQVVRKMPILFFTKSTLFLCLACFDEA